MAGRSRSFFDVYASEYDFVTNAAQRKEPHGREVQALVDQFHPSTVLDAGCATGLSTRLFAERQIPTTGIDISSEMVRLASVHPDNGDLPLRFREAAFESLPKDFTHQFSLVVCLANSISGVPTPTKLNKALRSFERVLRPGGTLVIQALNFASVSELEPTPVRATRKDHLVYLRYMERHGLEMKLSIIRLDTTPDPPAFELFQHAFHAYTRPEFLLALKQAGFSKTDSYGNLLLTQPFGRSSKDLVLVAQKPTR